MDFANDTSQISGLVEQLGSRVNVVECLEVADAESDI